MAGAGTGRERIKGSVFQKLEGKAGVGAGDTNLQYPSELGDDEYNHFVLFTAYEKNSEEVIEAQKRLSAAEEVLQLSRTEDATFGSAFMESIADKLGLAAEDLGVADIDTSSITFGGVPLSYLLGVPSFRVAPEVSGLARRVEDLQNQLDNLRKNATWTERERATEDFINETSQDAVNYYGRNGLGLNVKARNQASLTSSRLRLSPATYKQSTNIALYIPQKLINNGSISYNNVNFEVAQGINAITQGDFGSIGPGLKRYASQITDSLLGFVGVNANTNEAITAITGLAINPRAEQIFNGVSTRSFDMSFRLVPRNQSEAVEVSNIIRAFRKYSHPSVRAGNFFLTVPAEFDIRYYRVTQDGVAVENLFLNKIGRCALTSVNVDYSPSSVSSFFYDGSPVSTALTMTFTEFRPLTREDIEEGF